MQINISETLKVITFILAIICLIFSLLQIWLKNCAENKSDKNKDNISDIKTETLSKSISATKSIPILTKLTNFAGIISERITTDTIILSGSISAVMFVLSYSGF